MKIRDNKTFDNLDEIAEYLGDPERVGKNMTWVAKNYSLAQLIYDLREVKNKLENSVDRG